ncbi:MAG: nucleotide exchange factor GrpE [Alcanivorax sp.]|jgi:molecular chaperone GrpE|tara:strand:+ start:2830 stop:3405 length:576 start_codon:yes stop_codon:yes gene_type:complete
MSEEQKAQEQAQEEILEQNAEQEAPVEDVAEAADDALAAAQEEVAAVKDQMLRVQAEMQNVRRRAELDVEKAHKFAVEKFANEMVTVVDNLERGLAAAPEEEATKAIRDGMAMTLDGLINGLARFKVEQVNPEGETFNPELHQAMSMVENPDLAPNTVIAVMQKGYTLNGRLLRPAMVMVSKGAAQIDENA